MHNFLQSIEQAGQRRILGLQIEERLGLSAEKLNPRLAFCTVDVLDEVAKLLASLKPNDELALALEQLLPSSK